MRARLRRLVTIDCDGQHEPQAHSAVRGRGGAASTSFPAAAISSSTPGDSEPPAQRPLDQPTRHRRDQSPPGAESHRRLLRLQGLSRRGAAAAAPHRDRATPCRWSCGCRRPSSGLQIIELPVPLIYLDEKRSFGGALDDADDPACTTITRCSIAASPPLAVSRQSLRRAVEMACDELSLSRSRIIGCAARAWQGSL